jgi:hypothetical protein
MRKAFYRLFLASSLIVFASAAGGADANTKASKSQLDSLTGGG